MKFIYYAFFLLHPLFDLLGSSLLEEANLNYQKGEQAASYPERKKAFNQALKLYLQLEEQEGGSSSALNQALADTYFQLGEYPWSILYNYRALKLDPGNSLILSHLALAKEKLGLDPAPPSYSRLYNFAFTPFLSFPHRFELIFWALLATLLTGSMAIWWNKTFLNYLFAFSSLSAFLLLSNVLLTFYFGPIEAILVRSTGLYRAPDIQFSQLSSQPLLTGSKVRVANIEEQGTWLKIITDQGQVGYIPAFAARLI
ncbi:SH3 domain-containing protein [Candidatus Protochlamydia phocaeensis]|uniref:SH3 domain-containing protein n=1 Tax=Candidatus Protochlamydia phocaeensis TaxID=1414722 RepID=UPI0008383BBA|nr:SH3 domain-containing protein [Candidatus Protochlamydia phocaeensis]